MIGRKRATASPPAHGAVFLRPHSRTWTAYGLAFAVTGVTLFLDKTLGLALNVQPPAIVLVIPIIIAAYAGGLGPGLMATLLSVFGVAYFFLTPIYSLSVENPVDHVRWVTLVLAGTFISILTGALHRARQRAEAIGAERQEAGEHLRAIVESAPQGVLMVDGSGSIRLVNRELERAFGYVREELVGKPIELLLPAGIREHHAKDRQAFTAQPETRAMGAGRDLRGLRKDGTELPVEVGLVPINVRNEPFVLATVVDISLRLQAEAAARKTERLLQAIADNLVALIWVKDLDGRYQIINGSFEKLIGRTRDSVVGKTDFELFTKEEAELFRKTDQETLAAGKPVQSEEIIRRDGQPFTYLSVKCPLLDDTGRPYGLCGMSTDITGRKLDEEALASERSLMRTLIDSLPDVVFSKDLAGRFTLCNAAELRNVGFSNEDQLIGKTVFDLYSRELAEIYHADDMQALGGQPILNREEPSLDAAGNRRWFQTTKVPLRSRKNEIVGLVGVSRDITERKRAEDVQRSSQKMEALGTLAGGIAHDFNNILLAITGNALLAIEDLSADHPARESLKEIDKASLRASELVQRILAFSRQQEIRRTNVQLQTVIEEALKLLRPTLPAMIRIETQFAADIPAVAADAGQVHQVIMNLATNSAYAIGQENGLIEIAVDSLSVNDDIARLSPGLREGRYVRLSLSDNGCGMNKATLERVFDPFFTTKPAGQGTGLGLSTVHGIMQSHDGAVTVYSAPGQGTTFRLYFPAAGDAAIEVQAPRTAIPRSNGERVLYVDDEPALVQLATRILGRLGYSVSGYTDPALALQTFKSRPHDYDAVVTDLSMPVLSGFDLSRAVLEIRPDIPIVMMSGYVRPEDQQTASQIGIRELMLKPNSIDDLGRALDAVLRESAGKRPDNRKP